MKLADRALNISPSPLINRRKAKEMALNGHKVVSFGAGEPDYDTPDHIKEAAIARSGPERLSTLLLQE